MYLQQFSLVIKHKFGALKKVGDLLSQKVLLLITVRTKVLRFDLLKDSLFSHPFFGPILSDVIAGQKDDFLLHDEFLCKGNQLCIPKGSLRLKII